MNQKKTRNSNNLTNNGPQAQATQTNQNSPAPAPNQANPANNGNHKNSRRKRKPVNSPRAKAIREYTAGGIVYRFVDDRLEVLLLQDVKGRWSIPKGHVESGETLEQTAIREIGEETGLRELKIVDKLDKIHFFYRMNGKLIFMTTFVFMIESLDHSEAVVPENSEGIVDVAWFEAEKAHKALEYKATKVILREAINRLGTQAHV